MHLLEPACHSGTMWHFVVATASSRLFQVLEHFNLKSGVLPAARCARHWLKVYFFLIFKFFYHIYIMWKGKIKHIPTYDT